jgi:hypothetical protein
MASTITFSIPHNLTAEAARLKLMSAAEKKLAGGGEKPLVSYHCEGNNVIFKAEVFGLSVNGNALFEDKNIAVTAEIPFILTPEQAESMIRAEIGNLLAET